MGFRFDCAFCDATLETDTVDGINRAAKEHLEDHQYDGLREVFAVAFGGKRCRNDCGYTFAERPAEVDDFECPACGHDNFPGFVDQYVYWRIERT